MMKYHIFLDTNILQHPITHLNSGAFLALHKENIEFYKNNESYILPQVYNELKEHGVNHENGLGEFIKFKIIDDTLIHSFTIYKDLYVFVIKVVGLYEELSNKLMQYKNLPLDEEIGKHEQLLSQFKSIIGDGFLYLSTRDNRWIFELMTGVSIELLYEKIISSGLIPEQCKTTDEIGMALANIIEGTKFGEQLYQGLTYRDIYRGIGNFTFDYKNYKSKGQKQQQKVGKDGIVSFDIILAVNILHIDLNVDKVVFITSDYDFFKELLSFIKDIKSKSIYDLKKYYHDLSPQFIANIELLKNNISIIKLNVTELVFELENGTKDRNILNLL